MDPRQTRSWNNLKKHYETVKDLDLKAEFARNPGRAEAFTMVFEDLLVDYSKNLITSETEQYLNEFAQEMDLEKAIASYF